MSNSEIPTLYSCENDLLEKVRTQMEKEIEMSRGYLLFKGHSADVLVQELATFIQGINSSSNIQNLLYRVDVNTKKISTDLPYHVSISKALWDRVFQKVWFRIQFSSNKKLSD